MRKSAFCIFLWPYVLIPFSFLTITVRGVSNKHCLLPFFHFFRACQGRGAEKHQTV